MNKRFVLTILLAVFCVFNGKAQEYLTGFNGLPQEETQNSDRDAVAALPFFDDFSKLAYIPDQSKWMSRNVFVNSGFPKFPVNFGAATFDVVDQYGKVYSRGSSNPFIADSLLSVKIRLDSLGNQALTPADSIYFSFYYQPGGFGDSPERDDSLVLQFGYGYDKTVFDTILQDSVIWRLTKWKQVWASEGMTYETFIDSLDENHYFKKVMIPIVDPHFFVEDFQILFYNYGTLPTTMYPNDRSNMDMWNIDFVYLDKNRSIENDTYPTVSFSNPSPTLLKRYSSMPYKHYKENPINEINSVFNMYLTDMDINAHEVRYSCEIDDNNSDWHYSYIDNPFIINQYWNVGVVQDSIVMGDFIYPYSLPVDTTSFTIRHYIDVIDEHGDVVKGDSIVYHQGFYNYFAYDDGTPEMGYGVTPSDTYFAMQFKVTKLDTLSGVQMLFNRTLNDANYNFFDIMVWKDNNGKPGQVLYTLKDQRPIWDDEQMYRFSYYEFDKTVKVNSTFYVGIRQQYSKTINIGFDSSTDNHKYVFYEVGEGWKNSSFPGSLMIRPVMGKNPYYVGIEENQEVTCGLNVYPNPTNNVVRIEGIDADSCKEIVIYDLAGRAVKQYQYCNELNVSELQNGVYMLRVINNDGSFETVKLLITK